MLNPLGALFTEPDRLLLEELPPAAELRPILDAIGLGAHRVSEIAARIGRPVTSLARAMQRLQEMGLIRRETPFGESENQTKRSLYVLADPFVRLWFRVVAPHRGRLLTSTRSQRIGLLRKFWPELTAKAFEELCRSELSVIDPRSHVGRLGPWESGRRWWQGNAPEWDVVSRSTSAERILAGEVKWSAKPFTLRELEGLAKHLAAKPLPPNVSVASAEIVRVLFVPAVVKGTSRSIKGIRVVTAAEMLSLTR